MTENSADHGELEDPSDVLRTLLDEWKGTLDEHENLATETDDAEQTRRHRGRAEALRQGIRRLEAKDLEADPFRAAGQVSGRLHDRMGELSTLIAEGAPLEDKHRAIHAEMETMRRQLNDARERIFEELDEEQRPHPDDWEWVSEEVRARVLEAWGYEE